MTKKQYNTIRAAAFDAAMEIPDVSECVAASGGCTIYEVLDAAQQHGYITVARKTQMNDNTLRASGYDPNGATVREVLHVSGATKCATFYGAPIIG